MANYTIEEVPVKELDKNAWELFSLRCRHSKTVRGGAMCYRTPAMINYCSYDLCPWKRQIAEILLRDEVVRDVI